MEEKKERNNRILFIALLFVGLVFSIVDVLGYEFRSNGFMYSIYCAVILFNFSYSPIKLSYIGDLQKSYKFKLSLFKIVCFLEYVPMAILIINSTGIYSVLPFQKVISWIFSIIAILIFFSIYLVFSLDEAKETLLNDTSN